MDIVLWRHGDAHPGEADVARKLTGKGRKQVAHVAAWLDRHLPESARVLSSPARRCLETAEALGRKVHAVDALLEGEVAALLEVAGWPDARNCAVLVGHQPVLGYLATTLLCGRGRDFAIRKAGVVWLSNRPRGVERDGADVILRAAIGPDTIP